MGRGFFIFIAGLALFGADNGIARDANVGQSLVIAQARRTCKTVSSCREAVIMWREGYSRADADKDGIPCENVCPNKKLVDEIRAEIGC
ncbi:hypothetical protein NA8A_12625 [Nitratireductor indicus C115]|uniref:Uncharacterized protein n=1 Tax=Nitratireductor indicus C115 TaxID=1231190 RepID=K2P3E9_9HYPH|nr:excalibur calcium-binding domain-containing protein [Nitratireductor indicus]EKF41916.1 hypothetical protein NA8A_12625 [Nitratireductor indicus C115]SFQ48275.1 Excalibur calcium-binding domain-containing protein [Nitratireductor indicus]